MAIEHDMQKRSIQLVNQINEAEKLHKPIDGLVKEHINLLEDFHDVFIKRADENLMPIVYKVKGEVEIYENIRLWAKKIGLPIDKYNKKIFELRASILGEKRTRELFSDND